MAQPNQTAEQLQLTGFLYFFIKTDYLDWLLYFIVRILNDANPKVGM